MNAFLSYVVHGIAVGCGFALLASGLIIIHRVTRVVNLAQGTFSVIAAFTAATLLGAGFPHGVGEFLAIATAAAFGLLTGIVAITKRGTTPQASLVVTLGIGMLAYALEILIWGDQPRSFAGVPGSVELWGHELLFQHAFVILATLVVFVLLEGLFERTYWGKALTACASNPYAARLVGIPVVRMGLLAFVIGAALGGVAGVLLTPLAPMSYDTDLTLFVNGFAAAILAGLKSPLRALGGGIALGVAEALVAGYAKASYQSSLALLLALAILVVQGVRRPSLEESER
jgi:branched-chain amino acid transport system permease protein